MDLAVTIVSPPGYQHSEAFREVAESIHFALISLGHDSVVTTEGALPGRQHIVLGANLLPHFPIPIDRQAILYNLEQAQAGSPWFQPEYFDVLRRHAVWDYSAHNALALGSLGVEVDSIVPIGYVEQLTRITHAPSPDIDVLFIGSMNPRRTRVLEEMEASGLSVHAAFGVYGSARDALIGRAKVVLNVHYYEAKVLEMVRISYLLANHCVVLSEPGSDPLEDAAFSEGIVFAEYDRLAERACELVQAPDECALVSKRGFELFSARPASEYLRSVLGGAA